MFLTLHRGLQRAGKAVGQLTAILLALMLVGAAFSAAIIFSTAPAFYVVALVGVGPIVTPILFMVVWCAASALISIYIYPHVQPQIGKAFSALLDAK